MSKIYVFENFNNYANKTSLMYQTINLYPKAAYEATINFNPNDGANTSLVLMYKDNVLAAPINLEPDYAIVCDNSDKIESRWYVTDSSRLSDSKFRIVLKRDIASDYKSEIMNSVAFVKRGWVNSSNPLIFNSENGNYSQILRERVDLKDKSGKGGYVAFLAPNFLQENVDKANINVATNTSVSITFDTPASTHAGNYKFCYGADPNDTTPKPVYMRNYNTWGFLGTSTGNHSYVSFNVGYKGKPWGGQDVHTSTYKITIYEDGSYQYVKLDTSHDHPWPDAKTFYFRESLPNPPQNMSNWILEQIAAAAAETIKKHMWDNEYLDTYLFDQSQGQYGDVPTMKFMAPRISSLALVKPANNVFALDFNLYSSDEKTFEEQMTAAMRAQLVQIITKNIPDLTAAPINDEEFYYPPQPRVHYSYNIAHFHWRQTDTSTLKLPSTGALVQNSPYYMLFIPEANTKMKCGDTTWTQQVDAYQIYNQLQVTFNSFIYDVQKVPYTPYALDIQDDGTVVLPNESQIGFAKNAAEEIEACAYFCNQDSFWFDIEPTSTYLDELKDQKDLNVKIQSETTLLRLCSMDGSSSININGAKNLGLSKLRVNCRYAPYQSYISLQPQWSMFYGAEIGLKDTRGLNLTSTNSVTRTSNQWQDYVLQNQNYQDIFNRQIQSMDAQFDIQANKAVGDMVFGLVNTGVSAGMSSNPGSAAGSLIHGGLNLIQQGQGYSDMVDSFRERRSLSVDMFNLQNGNIKARADTLSKVNAMSPIYNTWPYIEIYTTTPEEKTALTTYITEFSMNIGAMTSQLSAYVTNNPNTRKFIQADIIRMSGKMDSHLAEEIRSLISEGVYYIELGGTTNESGTSAVNTEND